jgi:hypothetical protein
MKFDSLRPDLLHIHAVPWDTHWLRNQLIVVEPTLTPLMVGKVLKLPKFSDQYSVLASEMHENDYILCSLYNPTTMEPYGEPISGQQIMYEGEYLVHAGGLEAVIKIPSDVDPLSPTPPTVDFELSV